VSVYGVGIRRREIEGACVRIAPWLPPSWTELSFPLFMRDQPLDVALGHDGPVVTARPDIDITIEIAAGEVDPTALEPGGAVQC
jgi:trehalose/maltose hydrolase-like predicted phosphorylase